MDLSECERRVIIDALAYADAHEPDEQKQTFQWGARERRAVASALAKLHIDNQRRVVADGDR